MKNTLLVAAAALAIALPATAPVSAQTETPAPSPNDIVESAAPEEWVSIPAEDLLVMTLAPDADGNPREVIIQLMPAPFSQGWVENIRTLARAEWYDGISVNRVQDNYVVQWGDPGYDNPESGETEQKPLPEGLRVMGEDEYVVTEDALADAMYGNDPDELMAFLPPEVKAAASMAAFESIISAPDLTDTERAEEIQSILLSVPLDPSPVASDSEEVAMISIDATSTENAPEGWHQRDSYAEWVELWRGWPLGNRMIAQWRDANDNPIDPPNLTRHEARAEGLYQDVQENWFWPVHCYGMVGVGRNYSPDTGTGAELYTVIGHAPRHLDRNIALVGRVIAGMEHLSSLPRGSGALGFYTEDEADKRTPILSVRVSADLPERGRRLFSYLSTESETFARYAEARANRRDPFFIHPARGADICNIPVPIIESEAAIEGE